MINKFVDKIIVHEADRSSGERVQEVDSYLKFIGKVDIPEHEPMEEELAALEALKKKRAKKREWNRRYIEKWKRREFEKLEEQECQKPENE